MMPRNLDRRVEAMLRVTDRRLRARLDEILELNFADDALAWSLETDGTWVKVPVVDGHRRAGRVAGARDRAHEGAQRRRLIVTKPSRARVSDVVRAGGLVVGRPRLDANEPALWTERDPEAVHQARDRDPAAALRPRARCTTSSTRDWARAAARRAALARRRARRGPRRRGAARAARRARRPASPTPDADAARAAIRRLDADHAAARAELLRALRSPRYAQLHRALHDAVTHPRLTHCADARARPTRCPTRSGRRGAGCAARSTSSARCRPTPRCTRCGSAPSGAATRPSSPLPSIGRPARELATARRRRCRTCSASTRTRSSPTRGSPRPRPSARPAEAYALGMLAEIERGLAARARAAFPSAWDAARRPHVCGRGCERRRLGPRRGRRRDPRRRPAATVEVLVVHRPRYDDWSLPEGQGRARARRDEDAARREVEEETGYRVHAG